MEPITAAIVGSQVAGSVMSFKGTRAAAKSARQVAEINAQVAQNEAVLLARAKRDEEAGLRRQGERLIASQRTATAASGIQMSGSALQALASSYYGIEADAAKIIRSLFLYDGCKQKCKIWKVRTPQNES